MTLLTQLWALNEQIQAIKLQQERRMLDKTLEEEEDEDLDAAEDKDIKTEEEEEEEEGPEETEGEWEGQPATDNGEE